MCGNNGCCPDITALGDIVQDEICGTFNIPCSKEGTVAILWELDANVFNSGAQSSASVSVFYEQGCDDILSAIITKLDGNIVKLSIPKLNTRAYSLVDIVSLKIICEDKVNNCQPKFCRGKYCISLHYDVLVARI